MGGPRALVSAAFVIVLALVPLYSLLSGDPFALTLFTRIVILALAAVSLNLIMGYGGMVSFGHAVYLGIGGYAVGIYGKKGSGRASCNGRSQSASPHCLLSLSAP